MSKQRDEILRLKACLACDYDLTSLPRNHHCPECGTPYNGMMFRMGVWRTNAKPSIALTVFYGVMALPGLAAVAPIFVAGLRSTGSVVCPLVWTLGFGGACILSARQLYLRSEGRTDALLTLNGAEISLSIGRKHAVAIPWHRVKRIYFSKSGRYWRLRIPPPFLSLNRARFDVSLSASRRQAAVLRNEICRRRDEARLAG